MLLPAPSILRRRLLDAAFIAAAAGGLIIVVAAPGTVSGSGLPPGRPAAPIAEFSETPPDTPAHWIRGTIPRTHADSLLAVRADSTYRDSLRIDSLRTDSLRISRRKFTIADTTYVVDKDSTERIRDFVYVRHDDPLVEPFPERTYPLFAQNHAATYRREMAFDSTGSRVVWRETVGGIDAKIPETLPLKEYIAARLKYERRQLLAAEARKTKVLVKKDIGDMLANITKISIPVPANPLFSIFGKNEINLNVTGAVDIKAGFRSTKSDQVTLSTLDQVRNEPDFNQEVQVNVNGTIGDKLNILADWNTKRTFEYENQLKIKYTGFEDEIVQSVEAGNVSLATPSAFIGSSQALFGIKAKFQLGPLTLTTLASQKKGQIKEVAVTGGSQESDFQIRPYEFATNHFFVDTLYRSTYEPYYQNEPPTINRPELQIVEAEVWVQRSGIKPDPNERHAIAFIHLDPWASPTTYDGIRNLPDSAGAVDIGPVVKLDKSQYELDGDGYIGELSLNLNVADQLFVGIAYRTAGNSQYGELTRTLNAADTTIVLKLVKPKNLLSNGRSYSYAWNQLLKNIYPIPGLGRNLKQQGFQLDIVRQIPGAQDQNSILNEPLLRVMGFGKYSPSGTLLPPEQQGAAFDFRPQRTVSIARAEVIFPSLRPFDDGIRNFFNAKSPPPAGWPDSSLVYPAVYDTTQTFAQQSLANRYLIKGKATGDATSQFSLGFNVVEGSVQVLLDGRPLLINVDYTVDYIIGQVVIRNAAALVPGANLSIKFEQNDLFQLASKTLLGARADLTLGPTTALGFTIMNLNQQTLSDKVRLGEEPSNNTIYGIDGGTSVNLPFLTRAIDAIPGLSTKEPSSLKVSGEVAFMRPNPNTLASTIPSDRGQGVAYIDDFEGARRTIPVGIGYAGWTDASPPADPVFNAPLGGDDVVKMNSKGRMIWFNRLPTDVRLTDIYPRKQVGNPANDLATVLDFQYTPLIRGAFNYTTDKATNLTPSKNWGGVMKPLSVSAINLLKENVNFIEVWMRVDKAPPGSKMYVDLGAVNEAVVNDGTNRLHGEDLYLGTTAPGILLDGEDVGLDMLPDAQEQSKYSALVNRYGSEEPGLASDPSGDNFSFDNTRVATDPHAFDRINGTEGNANGPTGRYPDTEDINHNGTLDQANSYFEYELNLDTVALHNPQVVGGGGINPNNGAPVYWYQFRIPITGYTRVVGNPTAENIEFIRCYFQNSPDSLHVRIADFNLVGNQWQKQVATTEDTSYNNRYNAAFDVSVVGVEQNPAYNSPPGVIGERDKTQTDYVVRANEQSLDVILKDLPSGQSRQAVKFYTYKALDVFNYRTMKMFVHGDAGFRYVDTANYDARMFFRFGLDSLNYYEYSEPIHPGWDQANEVQIHFADITSIKQVRDSATVISKPKPVPLGPQGSYYRVLGNPSLTNIVYLSIGVENPTGGGQARPLNGEVWFDELRLIDVDNTPGTAWRMDTQLKLADLASVAFNYSRVDPYFHTLEASFGSRALTTSWALSASMALDKFFPESWAGTTIPVSYSHSESLVAPKYLSNSDIDVTSAASDLRALMLVKGASPAQAQSSYDSLVSVSQSRRVSDTYAAPGFHIVLPSQAWYIRDTFNKLNFSFNYTKSKDLNPSVVYSLSWAWSARVSYAVSLPPDYFVMPFRNLFDGVWLLDEYKNLKIFFPLANFNWALSANRSRANSLQRVQGATELVSRQFTMSRSMGFSWKATEGGLLNWYGDYSLSVESSLLGLELDQFGNQRPFSTILNSIFLSDHLINFGQDTRYAQHNAFNTKPNIPNIFNIKKFLDVSGGYSVDYSWQNTLSGGDLGKSAGWSNNINLSLNLKLKQLFDPLFEEKPAAGAPPPPSPLPRGRRGSEEPGIAPRDTSARADTTAKPKLTGIDKTLSQLKNLAKVFLKVPLLDYDNINITFTQSNQVQNSGVIGTTGFVNFWGRVPFFQQADPRFGPSRLYQLGLISDPDGRLTNFGPRPNFPFFGWDVEPGPRAMVSGGAIVNSFRETNRLSFKTSRDLWEGARIDLNWNVGWSYSRNQNLATDTLNAIPTLVNQTISGSVDRSFLTFPDVLFLGTFKTSLKEVSKQFAALRANDTLHVNDEQNLTTAFEKGFEALPILKKLFGQYYPRVNWSFRWDGLEKLPLFQGFVSRLSLDHTYNSNFTRQFENTPGGGGERTDGERVSYGFTPLVGANFTFKELLKGSFGANLRYNTTTSYDLSISSRNIVETLTQEISITASYSRKGFEIPFFGLSLSNDVDVSLTYSISKNSRNTYDVSQLDVNVTGVPLEGSTRTQMEPRIKYVLSQRVTASVYYRYTRVQPDFAGSSIPGTTENEAGLDIHIAIQ